MEVKMSLQNTIINVMRHDMILFTCIIFELSSDVFYSALMIKFISLQCGLIHFFCHIIKKA